MLIGSTAPYLILYHKGYVRRCLHDYRPDDDNLMIHLTNQYVQKRDAEYKNNLEDTVWSMDKFNDYINIFVAPHRGLPQDWVYTVFSTRMKQIMLFCFNAVKHKLKCRMGYFDLYGLDFMIDEQMKIWLIEINSNPSLATNCKSLKEVIPGVVKESLHIAIECFEKVRRNKSILPINAIKGFEIIYCGTNARRKPGLGNRIEAVSPLRSSPTGFFTNRSPSLSPLLRSRSLSPARDSPTQGQLSHRHITYQTPNQRRKHSSPHSAHSPNSDVSGQSSSTGPGSRSESSEGARNSGTGSEQGVNKQSSVLGFGRHSANSDVPSSDGSQSAKSSSSPGNVGQDPSRKMPRLEGAAGDVVQNLHETTRRQFPVTHHASYGRAVGHSAGFTEGREEPEFSRCHQVQNDPRAAEFSGRPGGGKSSPHLYLTPRQSSKLTAQPGGEHSSATNSRRLAHKISLTGIRLSEPEKDLVVDAKTKPPPVLSDELTLLTDIRCKEGSATEAIGIRQALAASRKCAPADGRCQQMNTARVADLSTELKLAKELVRLPSTILQPNKNVKVATQETVVGENQRLEKPTLSQAKPNRYKQIQCDETASSSTRLKLENYGRQKKAARVGAS
ncbi:hypothetical protein LSH36_114g02029 [Paralvinella palmiformis]|uniref:Uncharacterized protein n=1 Tax=Paralvinella palmiformis TaxID=53620 RepID=A0AAD9K0G1_9ANNE|nr:hypothetical protein LSH36_114g02029 [Paralvinella palmiformis]